jgi:DNA-binding PadR family transcriptional regulator
LRSSIHLDIIKLYRRPILEEAVKVKKPWFHILVAVASGTKHGAEIRRRVQDDTDGEVTLYPVTLYRSLDELTAQGLIKETADPEPLEHNEKRRYYVITAAGRKALAAEADALQAAARVAHAVLEAGGSR